jgi:GNAT superfamily N-acetyltransferase
MEVNQLSRCDESTAVGTLTAAFAKYPLFPPLCPDASRRPKVIEAFCQMLFLMSATSGGAFATRCRSAVACALPPESEWPSTWNYLRAGILSLLWRLRWRGGWWFHQLGPGFDRARELHMGSRAHWYLHLLGVRPEAQGKGLTRVVLEPIFVLADQKQVPIYLETMPEANVPIYQKLGFDLLGRSNLHGGLPNWEMARFPRRVS